MVLVRYETPPVPACAPVVTTVVPGDGEASVAFELPTSDGGAAITNYEYSSDAGATWTAFAPPVVTSPVVITGLTNDTVSAVALRAVNIAGVGPASNVMDVTPRVPVLAPTPQLPGSLAPLVTLPVTASTPTASPPPSTLVPTPTPATAVPAPPVGTPDPTGTPSLPDVPRGEVLVTLNGEPVDSMVLATEASTFTLSHADTRLQLSTRCWSVCPPIVTVDDGGLRMQVVRGSDLMLRATGFQPGAPVTVWVFSDPRRLANSVLDDDGSFLGVVPLTDIEPGNHTLQVNSLGASGDRLSFHMSLVVVAGPADPVAALPSTGGRHMAAAVLTATMAMVLGAAFVVAVRLRHR